MSTDKFHKDIITGRMCPYCQQKTEHVDSSVIYGKSYGMIYHCKPCKAWVGTHKNNPKKSLGRLADQELRKAKKSAHAAFDPHWKALVRIAGLSASQARKLCYGALSDALDIPIEHTHIGMFDIELCVRVIGICSTWEKERQKAEIAYYNSLRL